MLALRCCVGVFSCDIEEKSCLAGIFSGPVLNQGSQRSSIQGDKYVEPGVLARQDNMAKAKKKLTAEGFKYTNPPKKRYAVCFHVGNRQMSDFQSCKKIATPYLILGGLGYLLCYTCLEPAAIHFVHSCGAGTYMGTFSERAPFKHETEYVVVKKGELPDKVAAQPRNITTGVLPNVVPSISRL